MRTLLLALTLVCAGCTEQVVERQSAVINVDSLNALIDSADVVWASKCSLVVSTLPYNYREMINFATWCQKAHPEVWREYHKTITGN